ncbi:MAG: bacillithiol biosynthesis deacetylase BshB1 [Acidobacteriia bacterium]|nr:bacillithiol biosynthesis deacetylase BshB1 [Terriglobia bacterium]
MPLDILAFGAHPDDVELHVGGTLAKMAARGYAVGVVDLTRGELGTRGTPAIRVREARKAAGILGLKVRENLGLPDGGVLVTPATRLKVIRALRKHRPMIVLAPHWDEAHPDHANAGKLVAEAAHHAGLAKIRTGQEHFRPKAILYFMLPPYVRPTFIVDISEHIAQREAAIRAHRSQLFDPGREPDTYLSQPDFLYRVNAVVSYYGTLVGRAKGEAFFMKVPPEIPDLVDFFRRQGLRRLR